MCGISGVMVCYVYSDDDDNCDEDCGGALRMVMIIVC